MIKPTIALLATAILLVSGAWDAAAADAPVDTAQVAANKPPVYKPPLRGAPTRRVGGATRGGTEEDLVVSVLAPQGTGLTSRRDPSLYWYVSGPTSRQVEFTLIRDDEIKPVAEVALPAPSEAIIARVSLAELDVALQPDVTYEWSIALVADRNNRSSDIVTSGTVMYKAPGALLSQSLESADDELRVTLYSQDGYWYDAIEMASPGTRATLLDQVELPRVAAHARTQ